MGTDEATDTHKREYFRNVFTEPVGSLPVCADVDADFITQASECVVLVEEVEEQKEDIKEETKDNEEEKEEMEKEENEKDDTAGTTYTSGAASVGITTASVIATAVVYLLV